MLSGESAVGLYSQKVNELHPCCKHCLSLFVAHCYRSVMLLVLTVNLFFWTELEPCGSAVDKQAVDVICVYTKWGYMASLLSRNQLDYPIFACTTSQNVRQWINLQWGLISFCLDFGEDMESNLHQFFGLLKAQGMMKSGNLVIAVSDISSGSQTVVVQSIQVH